MTVVAPTDHDRSAVRRRLGSGRTDLARTLELARDGLRSRSRASSRFDGELLDLHARAQRVTVAVMPLPIVLTASGLFAFAGASDALVWMAAALVGYGAIVALTRLYRRTRDGDPDTRRWMLRFHAAHLAIGGAWAYFAGLSCGSCTPFRFQLFQFAVLFLAVALTALVAWMLRHVVLVAFAPVVAVLAAQIAVERDPIPDAMRMMLICAVPFFAVLAGKIRSNTVERMKHKAEKDELIAELDTARNHSEEARRRAEEANLAKSRFLATMSHELRTPLNAILGFSEVISNEILGPVGNESYKEYIKDIHASGQHLLELINEILDLSRVEAGRYDLNEEAVNLAAIAEDCLTYVRLKCENKRIRLKAQMEKAMPQLWADERALRQVILNLLSNAVKFTPENGIVTVRVGWTAGGGQYVSIEDTGPGISEEEMPIVLSAFGQGSTAIKAAEQGTGLGLPIVKALLHMHDGDFVLNSVVGEGTEAIAAFPHSRVLEVMPAFGEFG